METQRRKLLEQRFQMLIGAVRRSFEQSGRCLRMADDEIAAAEQFMRFCQRERQRQTPERLFRGRLDESGAVLDLVDDERGGAR